jgi:transcription initiation factor TFIIH subunit 3
MSNIFSDKPSLLAIILDLSPVQWALSSSAQDSPLTLSTFLSQLLAFLNAHLAGKAENTLAVFGALPGRAVTLYTSTDGVGSSNGSTAVEPTPDANSYQPFKVVDSAVVARIVAELDALRDDEEERTFHWSFFDIIFCTYLSPCIEPPALVGALTKALCCPFSQVVPP